MSKCLSYAFVTLWMAMVTLLVIEMIYSGGLLHHHPYFGVLTIAVVVLGFLAAGSLIDVHGTGHLCYLVVVLALLDSVWAYSIHRGAFAVLVGLAGVTFVLFFIQWKRRTAARVAERYETV